MCGNMVSSLKMTPWVMAVFCLVTAGCTNITDQQTSESQRDQVAILKQIRKVNEDGSYSFGYEAGDGSFKVESRDVLGNIKGTFGFVDADGEIKRVSYSSSNGTGFKATSVTPLQEQVSVVQSIPRVNRSSTTRKPTVVYATSTESSSSKSSVVQPIPRSRKTTTTASPTTSSTTTSPHPESSRPTFGHYIKATPKSRPRFVINGSQSRSTPVEENKSDDSQITRPNIDERPTNYRRILFAKRPIDHSLRPITEEFEDKEEESKITTGNTLRRQLHEETTKAHSPINDNVNEDHVTDVYTSDSLSTSRPLFTTTNIPPARLIHRVSTVLGTDRSKASFYVNQNNLGSARFDNNKYDDNPRVYDAEESKLTEDERVEEHPRQILIRGPQRISNDQQHPENEPHYLRHQQPAYLRDLYSTGLLLRDVNTEEDPIYRTDIPPPIGRILYRHQPNQHQPLYSTSSTDPNVRYPTESPITESEENSRMPVHNYVRPRLYQRPLVYSHQDAPSHRPRALLRPIPQPIDEPPNYSPGPPTVTGIALPPEPPNPIARPLSRRDFQFLLRRLLISQYGADALSYPRTYLEDALYDQQSYPATYHQASASPRQTLAYDSPASLPRRYGDRVPLTRHGYTATLNPLYQPQAYDDYQEDMRYPKRVYRQKFYTQEVNDEGDEILPPPIREALLLRMLQLAINAERPTMATVVASTTTVPTSMYRKTGPVRSVQIITDDDDDDNDSSIRKKI